jgi:hypothetical protein
LDVNRQHYGSPGLELEFGVETSEFVAQESMKGIHFTSKHKQEQLKAVPRK